MSRKGKVPVGESKLKVDGKSEKNFLGSFEAINDIRSEKNGLYSVAKILLVTLLTVICTPFQMTIPFADFFAQLIQNSSRKSIVNCCLIW